MSKLCQICFSPRADLADILREDARRLIATYNWEGGQSVLDNINNSKTIISIHDHLAVLRVAEILTFLGEKWPKPRLEECCNLHPTRGPHDIVLPLKEEQSIVVEVKRLDRATAAGDMVEEEITEYVCKHPPLSSRLDKDDELNVLKEDNHLTSKGHRLVFLLDEIGAKQNQLDPGGVNVVWVVSRNVLFERMEVEDAAHHYQQVKLGRLEDQPGRFYRRPDHLTALAWSFDGPSGSYSEGLGPCCALLDSCPVLADRMEAVGVRVNASCIRD